MCDGVIVIIRKFGAFPAIYSEKPSVDLRVDMKIVSSSRFPNRINISGNLLTVVPVLICMIVLAWAKPACAEDGYDLWLRYPPVESQWKNAYRHSVNRMVMTAKSPTLIAARDELQRGLSGLLGTEL